ncbi:MAG TPA: conjugative transposon protein TraM [Puia sp.]|nr:conjugative transposon protein TraM [Puia sp.]
MKQIRHSPKFLRKRKFMLMLPLLILPFAIILFLVLGGGRESSLNSGAQKVQGLNVKLPDAHFKKGGDKSKLSLYEEASKDSAILKEKIKNDPYYSTERQLPELTDSSMLPMSKMDENETRIMDKLAKLKAVIHGHNDSDPPQSELQRVPTQKQIAEEPETLISGAAGSKNRNPDLDQLNAMLDKVMAIQHPEILADSLSRVALQPKPLVFPVNLDKPHSDAETFGSLRQNIQDSSFAANHFYDLASDFTIEKDLDNTFEAVIAETQTLVSGSTIRIRLLGDIRINGHFIAKDQFIYGITSLANERLKIQFSSIRAGNSILPVSLEAFDLDGLAGIYIPGSMNREVAKQSGEQAIGSIGLASLNPSIGAQAAGAGIEAAKSLLSRKIKLVKVTVKAGYMVLLKEKK